ncbi:MAG: TIM44-like domain-containing protein [Rhodoblastus sp.]
MKFRKFALFAALAAALSVGAADAWARPGGGSSMGSRGSKTYSAPPATRTAPNSAAPIERSVTPRTAPSSPNAGRPSSSFGRGLMGGLLGGLLGAGLFGMLFGHGLLGGLGGLTSFLGLLLQIGLIVLLARFAINFFRNRQAASAGAAPGPQGAAYRGPANGGLAGGLSGGANAGFGGFGGPAPAQTAPLEIAKGDFDAFERKLGEVQQAFSSEDIGALRRLCTPEIAAHLEQEIADNSARGVVNKITNVRLLQGDLAESWREPNADFATVAMRFALNDVLVEKASGRVVSGSATTPEEATELWTFRRASGADSSAWTLSAMQQAA